jgi:hypothetical protein
LVIEKIRIAYIFDKRFEGLNWNTYMVVWSLVSQQKCDTSSRTRQMLIFSSKCDIFEIIFKQLWVI